ncbi:MAG: DUF3267 domain-containing protein [Clostridia bacterium]
MHQHIRSKQAENYRMIRRIRLLESKAMGMISLFTLAAMLVLGFFLRPKEKELVIGFGLVLQVLLLGLGTVGYMLLHELIHGWIMQAYGGHPRYHFSVIYACAGSDAYFSRRQYMNIALMPVLLLGLLLLVLNIILYPEHYWFFYTLQMLNVSGAAGDLYVTAMIMRMPKDTVVQDTGTVMTFYSAQ